MSCIACDLTVFSPEERAAHEADTRALLALATIVERETFYGFDFADPPGPLLERWARDERRCCPFLNIQIEPRSLRIDGPPLAKDIVRALLATYQAEADVR